MKLIDLDGLQALLDALHARGYETIGPVRREGAIVYERIDTVAELPVGWTDRQAPGRYRRSNAMTRPCSATPSARTRGNATCSRLGRPCFPRSARMTAG